jgi:prefoldin subunit 5
LNQLRQESQIQKSHIQLFSRKIGELEKKLSRLKDIDQKIRVTANLERGQETLPFIGMGGPSPAMIGEKLKDQKDQK